MSWNFTIDKAADKAAAKTKVAEQRGSNPTQFPESARAVIDAAIDALPECEHSTISVETNGHFNGTEYRGTSSFRLTVRNDFAA